MPMTPKVVFHQHHRQDDQHSPRVLRMPSLYGSCDPDHHAKQDPLHAPLAEMLIAVLSLHSHKSAAPHWGPLPHCISSLPLPAPLVLISSHPPRLSIIM